MKNCIQKVKKFFCEREAGVDGILVTVGLCVIALVLCAAMKDSMKTFIETMITGMTTKATALLNG